MRRIEHVLAGGDDVGGATVVDVRGCRSARPTW